MFVFKCSNLFKIFTKNVYMYFSTICRFLLFFFDHLITNMRAKISKKPQKKNCFNWGHAYFM